MSYIINDGQTFTASVQSEAHQVQGQSVQVPGHEQYQVHDESIRTTAGPSNLSNLDARNKFGNPVSSLTPETMVRIGGIGMTVQSAIDAGVLDPSALQGNTQASTVSQSFEQAPQVSAEDRFMGELSKGMVVSSEILSGLGFDPHQAFDLATKEFGVNRLHAAWSAIANGNHTPMKDMMAELHKRQGKAQAEQAKFDKAMKG